MLTTCRVMREVLPLQLKVTYYYYYFYHCYYYYYEGDLLAPGVGRHLAAQHHAGVQGHGVQDLGAGLTRGRI